MPWRSGWPATWKAQPRPC